MLFLLALLWARLTANEVGPLLEEAPTIAENLGKAWPVVKGMFTGLLNYLTNEAQNADIASLQNQVNALTATFQAFAQAELYTQDREAHAMVAAAHDMHDIGGAVETIGTNQQRMWARLRYTIMPNTIRHIYTVVLRVYIWPLREGLAHTIAWGTAWFNWIQHFLRDDRSYTTGVQTTGRNWRARYVYPQLIFLLSPWRVAYYYQQQITTAVAKHVQRKENAVTRDTISRAVWDNMDNLWQAFDGALADWLQTDVGTYGWGADAPTWPKNATQAPPKLPPNVHEPAVAAPREHAPPPLGPKIPFVDFEYGP